MLSWTAVLPVALALIMLGLLRQSGWRAGLAAYALAALFSLAAGADAGGAGAFPVLVRATLRGMQIALPAALVLFFGLWLYRLMEQSGAVGQIAELLGQITQDPVRRVLLLTAALSPFFEGVTGFGAGLVIVAPLFLAFGYEPRRAAMLALCGQNAASWGAMAVGTAVGAQLAGLPFDAVGAGSAVLNAPINFFFNLVAVWLAVGRVQALRRLREIAVVSALVAALVWAGSRYLSVPLGAILAGVLAFLVLSGGVRRVPAALGRAALPYGVLVAVLLMARFWPGAGEVVPVPYQPSVALFAACLTAWIQQRGTWPAAWQAGRRAVRQFLPASGTIVIFVCMAQVLTAIGSMAALGQALAGSVGIAFVAMSPWLAAVGGFLSGSNAVGNAMFMDVQTQAAHVLGMRPDLFAYVQNAASGNATVASPMRLALTAAVTGQAGREAALLPFAALLAGGGTVLITATWFVWIALAS